VDVPGDVDVDGDWAVAALGDFWVAGDEVLGVCVCCAVEGVVELGDCANAAVAHTRPSAVLIRKRVFM
jgi:hypothetical protein